MTQISNKKIAFALVVALGLSLANSSVALAGYGSSPSSGGSNGEAPRCDNQVPGTPSFSFVRRAGSNQIEIGWNQVNNASSWTIAYGKESGKYIYGMSNFGDSNSRSVKINMLPVGTYYVVIKANNGCMPGAFSPERKITVGAGGSVLGVKTNRPSVLGAKVTPTSTNAQPTSTPTNGSSDNGNGGSGENLNFFQKLWKMIFGR